MAGTFPVKHSILDEDALAGWVRSRYPCREPVRCRFYRRSMSDVYRVDAGEGSYILKVYLHGRHSRPELEAELSFIHDLLGCDVAVAAPVDNRDGEALNEIRAPEGVRYAVLYQAVTGDQPRETDLEHSRAFGQLAGRLHRCADRCASEGKEYGRRHLDERYLIEEPLHTLEPYLEHRPEDLAYLRGLGAALSAELRRRLPKAGPEYGMCHGDLHTGNARFDRHGRLTLFDLDSCGYGWRAIDIGVYHVSYDWMGLGQEVRREKERFWAAFLEGYSTQRSLSEDELIVAQLCLPIRHLELMGVTIRYWSPQEGIHWINDEYLDGHLRWFRESDDSYCEFWLPIQRKV